MFTTSCISSTDSNVIDYQYVPYYYSIRHLGRAGDDEGSPGSFLVDDILVFTNIMAMQALLHALATPRRREILRLVWDAERPAGEIHAALGDVTFGAVSQHLRVLRD